MNTILAIDPGTTESQFLLWDGQRVIEHGLRENLDLVHSLRGLLVGTNAVCIEGVASYGMAVGKEVFDTCIWIGRFYQESVGAHLVPTIIYRKEVKMHLCHTMKAKDANIRQVLIDRFGGKDKAIGKKANPGPLYGISSHAWSALGLAITFSETNLKAA